MRPEGKKYLYDIRNAGEHLAEFATGKTFADYAADALLRSAVERQFEIIGEALSQAIKLEPDLASSISEAKRIISFRNILIHGYAAVSNEVVWDVLQKDLPTLRRQVGELLNRADS
ncbi:MAG: DUF86 domain-containing protein [Planctomycetota bacterium]|nr:DUF86 domain-containing protein [Planctomycetota bacterium]